MPKINESLRSGFHHNYYYLKFQHNIIRIFIANCLPVNNAFNFWQNNRMRYLGPVAYLSRDGSFLYVSGAGQ